MVTSTTITASQIPTTPLYLESTTSMLITDGDYTLTEEESEIRVANEFITLPRLFIRISLID